MALLFEPGAFHRGGDPRRALKPGRCTWPWIHRIRHLVRHTCCEDCQARLLLTDARRMVSWHRAAGSGRTRPSSTVTTSIRAFRRRTRPKRSQARRRPSCSTRRGLRETPRVVLHNHRNVLVEVRNYTNDVSIRPDDRLAVWHSFSFANSIRNLCGALMNGAAVFPYDLPGQGHDAAGGMGSAARDRDDSPRSARHFARSWISCRAE